MLDDTNLMASARLLIAVVLEPMRSEVIPPPPPSCLTLTQSVVLYNSGSGDPDIWVLLEWN